MTFFERRCIFLAKHLRVMTDAAPVLAAFEALSDAEQHEVERNLMHITSRTWVETLIWEHINKNGLRIDRD